MSTGCFQGFARNLPATGDDTGNLPDVERTEIFYRLGFRRERLYYELAVRMPEKYEEIRATQATRIQDPDRKREFNFIVRAVAPETETRDSLFRSLLIAGNRRIEPWVTQIVGYLNHPLRQQQAVKYIRPALQELQEVQRTGDIFFPKNWISATLRGHNSPEAAQVVRQFLEQHPDYPVLLKNKILQSADHLHR